jgi:hypothetical protein
MDRLARNLGKLYITYTQLTILCKRLMNSVIGGKAVLPIAFQYIPNMLGSPKWEQRHAALMAISAIGEGCVKIMEAELGKIIE